MPINKLASEADVGRGDASFFLYDWMGFVERLALFYHDVAEAYCYTSADALHAMYKNSTAASNSFLNEHYRRIENTLNILNFTIFKKISFIHKMIRMIVPTNIPSAINNMSNTIVN